MEQKNESNLYIQNISIIILGMFLMAFPIIFTTITTNAIIFPKQILLGIVVVVLLVLQIVNMFSQKSVKLRRTSFDIPILLLALCALLSCFLAINKTDALTAFFPYFLSIVIFFLIVNIAKDKNSLLFLISSLIIGSSLLSILAILSFFKIYILLFPGTHSQTFTPLGSLLEQAIYLVLTLAISFYYLNRFFKSKAKKGIEIAPENTVTSSTTNQEKVKVIGFGLASFIIFMGIIVTTYTLFKLEKPLLLPIETGFQTALSEISLDSGRVTQGFLLGSGFGTYSVDFSRWKLASFNQYPNLWSLTFFRSSDLPLELLATTGVLGLCAFIFLLIRVLREIRAGSQNKMLISVITLSLISILLPLNFPCQTLFFIILGLFAINQSLITKAKDRFFDIELQIVALKKGLIAMEMPQINNNKSLILPFITSVVILAIIGIMGYYGIPYISSDLTFQKSLIAESQNNGSLTYQLQAQAIQNFPYRDGFYRVFSQTNLALANALASQQPAGAKPNQTVQQNITTLIQQSINAARQAVTVAPQTNLNWQNLSSIYRELIGFGQNAESFAISTAQQGVSLDPNNPQGYIALGGIYYQLQQWDNAQSQFLTAVNLKPDYANSHYNLGHVLEQKGDLQNALAQYQTVRNIVANDKTSLGKIDKEIAVLQGKAQAGNENTANSANANQILNVNKPETQLPPTNPPVKIPAPNIATPSSK